MAFAYFDNPERQGVNLGAQQSAPVPRTISSAAARMDSLNERLTKAVEALAMVSSQIGAMTPVAGQSVNARNPAAPAGGAVNRFNDAADEAHDKMSEIENYIQSIGRALG